MLGPRPQTLGALVTRMRIWQAVEEESLAAVEGLARVRLPEPRLGQHGLRRHLRALDRAFEAAQEPFDPHRHKRLRDLEIVACPCFWL
jgi:hypothetical protein